MALGAAITLAIQWNGSPPSRASSPTVRTASTARSKRFGWRPTDMSAMLIPILGICCGLLAIFGGVFVKPWFALQQRRMEIEADKVAEKAAQYAAQTERLEERVRVLERIVTDRGADLAQEIERLRDEPAVKRLPVN
ncbi:hypothetical protein WR25_11533 [Diploscapter pachys]|uniref:Uncharacterized protein n=2 Tax=cellular organisms TaxID=131567 RepID=A0A2A2KA74_9BILA|nr:hypothetical protein WR25_11533 [Diploscapter pachys]